jgi:N-acetylneuraminic acid mutarotase
MPHNKIPYVEPKKDPEKIVKLIKENDGYNSDINADYLNNQHKDYYLEISKVGEVITNGLFNKLYLGRGSKVLFPNIDYRSPIVPSFKLTGPFFADNFKGKTVELFVNVKDENGSTIFTDNITGIDLTKISLPESIYSNPGIYTVYFEEYTEHHKLLNNTSVKLNIDDSVSDIKDPYITIEGDDQSTPLELVIKTSSFINLTELDSHFATDWKITDEYGKTVWTSLLDEENLTKIKVSKNTLRRNRDYTIHVTHYGHKACSKTITKTIHTEAKSYTYNWNYTGRLLTSRANHMLSITPDDNIWAMGGIDYNLYAIDTIEEFDIGNGTWKYINNLPISISGGHSSNLKDGNIIIVGGRNELGINENIFIYDFKTSTWLTFKNVVDLPFITNGIFTEIIETDYRFTDTVFLYAGKDQDGNSKTALVIISNNNNKYSIKVKLITNYLIYSSMASTLTRDNKVIYLGGVGIENVNSTIKDEVKVYVPDLTDITLEGLWTQLTNMPVNLSGMTADTLDNFNILVTGGNGINNSSKKCYVVDIDVTPNTWTEVTSLPTELMRHKTIKLRDGRILLCGGMGTVSTTDNVCLILT